MSAGRSSEISPQKLQAARHQEALRIGAALEHIKAHGNLDGFPGDRCQRVALVSTAGKQGLLFWNRGSGRYELTIRGRRHERAWRRTSRNALRDRQGTPIRSGVNAVVTGSGIVVVAGALFLAFNVGGTPNSAQPPAPSGHFTRSAPAAAQATRAQPRLGAEPTTVMAATIAGPKPAADVPAVLSVAARRIAPGEAAISLSESIGSDLEPVTGATTKTTAAERDRSESVKLASKPKKTARRRGEDAREVRGPGYAYGPYGGARRYGSWSGSWWYR